MFAAAGHSVTMVSRSWPTQAEKETKDGVAHIRLPGFEHTRLLPVNLILDFIWGIRAGWALPDGDVVICNTVSLPAWLPWLRPSTGRVAVLVGRLPKGQIPLYGRVARLYAPTRAVASRIGEAAPSASARTRVVGYPIDWTLLSGSPPRSERPVTIGFVGRLHPEKGIELLLRAARELADRAGLPEWRIVLMGPSSVGDGGGGREWVRSLDEEFRPSLGDRLVWLDPEFDPPRLAKAYGALDIFCYPSLSDRGETFGVAVAEAMASGCAAVVSSLDCFADLVVDGQTGVVFDHRGPGAPSRLADCLQRLVADDELRRSMAAKGKMHVRRFDFAEICRFILSDLSELTGAGTKNPQ